jgi:transposase-like protein
MDFPILNICDDELGEAWLQKYFHPQGLHCPTCGASLKQARAFGRTRRGQVTRHRCRHCETVYTVYTGTVFANKQLRPAQVILLLRGVCKGESTASLSRELHLAYDTVHHLRQKLHTNAVRLQPATPLPDAVTETDEMFQNAGEKRHKTQRSQRSPAATCQQAKGSRHVSE